MDWIFAGLAIVGAVLLTPLWSWMLRDMRRRGGGSAASAMFELNKIIEPSHRHVAEAKDEQRAEVTDTEPLRGKHTLSKPPPINIHRP